MVLLPLVFHLFCIDNISPLRTSCSKGALMLHISAFVEVGLSAFLTLWLSDPVGTLQIRSCKVKMLSDWYTLLHNPNPNYEETIHCTQEAVYPLYTMVLIFYAFGVWIMLLIRPWLAHFFLPNYGKVTIYAALYFYPILALFQAVFGGLIYYSFPYIIIILSVISNAAHFAFKLDQTMASLIVSTVQDLRNIIIILGHWGMHAFGIVALTELKDPVFHLSLIALVPLPAVFYILTARFTDPIKLHTD
ncbi:JNK1/MAPK8-associated membrane protein isoform X2 [Lycorma delicatula]